MSYAKDSETSSLVVRSIFFQTHVDRDLVFSQSAGRNTLAGGTTRTGWAGTVRYTGPWLDQAANLTLVRSTFDQRVIGVTAKELLAVPRRIGVAGGDRKYSAIRAALLGGWVNILITDLAMAHRLLDGA